MFTQVFSKTLKGRTVIGVTAGRFHTVLWTREAVYTMGLNGGQLGKISEGLGSTGALKDEATGCTLKRIN